MHFLCRMGRHKPARTKSLMDINDLSQETHCRRCGAQLRREQGGGWSATDAD
jgi:hypothetical protein